MTAKVTEDAAEMVSELAGAVRDFRHGAETYRRASQTDNHSQSTISINAGGVGVWVATTACLVMLGLVGVGALWTSSEFRRYDQQLVEIREENKTMQSFLSAIYQQAPQLRPKDGDEKHKDAE